MRLWGAEDDQCQPDGEAIQWNKANFQKSASALYSTYQYITFQLCLLYCSLISQKTPKAQTLKQDPSFCSVKLSHDKHLGRACAARSEHAIRN